MDFAGQVVIVTGGCRGVGRGITRAFLSAGADVVVCARRPPDRSDAAGEPPGSEHRAIFVAADVREGDDIAKVMDETMSRFGRLDVLVNNAGGSPPMAAADASDRFSASIIALNLLAPLNFAQRANAVMQTQDHGGSIINIGSVSGTRPSPRTAAYGAAKAGLANLTQTLAVEWAPKVRVNCVVAGMVHTEQSHLFYGDAEGIAAVGATVPLGRLAEPDDVAQACLFLASGRAAYISGANLMVHGGGELPAYLGASNAEPAGGPGHR
ncbi:MAG: SDR family oxidoreductase [Acidimicrobiales bacterium]